MFVLNGDTDNPLAAITVTTTFPDPVPGKTPIGVSSHIDFLRDVSLFTGDLFGGNAVNNDRLRLATFSSSFIGSLPPGFVLPNGTVLPNGGTSFDANQIRYEDANGITQRLDLKDDTPKDVFLFLDGARDLGDWVELVKTQPDSANPTSPTIRMDITDTKGARLGLQAVLFETDNPDTPEYDPDPTADSLQVWLEVLDSPDTILAGLPGSSFGLNYTVTAQAIPEPGGVFLCGLALMTLGIITWWRRHHFCHQ